MRILLLCAALVSARSAGAASPAPSDEELRGLYDLVDRTRQFALEKRTARAPAEVELGKKLFFDPRLSGEGKMSCATCHKPEKAWTDGLPRAVGREGKPLPRRTQTLLDLRTYTLFFWDGRAARLQDQVLFPIEDKAEMGADLSVVLGRLRSVEGYRRAFSEVYGRSADAQNLAEALTAFLESLDTPPDSPYDRGRRDPKAMSPAARRGFLVFADKGRCLACHRGPLFTENRFHNLGFKGAEDPGRAAVVGNAKESGAFRTPSLINTAREAPYMHDGRLKTLEEVVAFYDRGGDFPANGFYDLRPLHLSALERADLVAFLKSLSTSLPKVPRPVLPPDARTAPQTVAPAEAETPARVNPKADRRQPPSPGPVGPAPTVAAACRASSLDMLWRALLSTAAVSSERAAEDAIHADAIRSYAYRALAEGERGCARLAGMTYDFLGHTQSMEYICLDRYHELDLIRAWSGPQERFLDSCRRGLAWTYGDWEAGDVDEVCRIASEDRKDPAALCGRLAPRYLNPRLRTVCERHLTLMAGLPYDCRDLPASGANFPKVEDRCEALTRYRRARDGGGEAACGDDEECRALAGDPLAASRAAAARAVTKACGDLKDSR